MINTNKDISIFELQGKRVVHNELWNGTIAAVSLKFGIVVIYDNDSYSLNTSLDYLTLIGGKSKWQYKISWKNMI